MQGELFIGGAFKDKSCRNRKDVFSGGACKDK